MKPYVRIASAYLFFGVAWILLSDRLLELVTSDHGVFAMVQTLKGSLFVAVSTFLIYIIGRRAFARDRERQEEKRAVFLKTLQGSHHILLNYLNQMELVSLEAERCREFDRETLQIARSASDEAAAELRKLGEIDTVDADRIDAAAFARTRYGTQGVAE